MTGWAECPDYDGVPERGGPCWTCRGSRGHCPLTARSKWNDMGVFLLAFWAIWLASLITFATVTINEGESLWLPVLLSLIFFAPALAITLKMRQVARNWNDG